MIIDLHTHCANTTVTVLIHLGCFFFSLSLSFFFFIFVNGLWLPICDPTWENQAKVADQKCQTNQIKRKLFIPFFASCSSFAHLGKGANNSIFNFWHFSLVFPRLVTFAAVFSVVLLKKNGSNCGLMALTNCQYVYNTNISFVYEYTKTR